MVEHYDVIGVGTGPTNLAMAEGLSDEFGHQLKDGVRVLLLDCNKYCSGGLLNDGKMNLTPEIGFDPDYRATLGDEMIREHIGRWNSFCDRAGVNPNVSGVNKERILYWAGSLNAAGLRLVQDTEQRHIGTDNARKVITAMKQELEQRGIEFGLEHLVKEVEFKDGKWHLDVRKVKKVVTGKNQWYFEVIDERPLTCDYLNLAMGRGKVPIELMCGILDANGGKYEEEPLEAGARVETPSWVYNITQDIRDPKIKLTRPNGDRVKTFCTNPGGKLTRDMPGQGFFIHDMEGEEPYEYRPVNGDGLERKDTGLTNFAILTKFKNTKPHSSTMTYAQRCLEDVFDAAGGRELGGRLLLQQAHKFMKGEHIGSRWVPCTSRTQPEEIDTITTTISKHELWGGDIASAYKGRLFNNIAAMLAHLAIIFPKLLDPHTILVAPEIKAQNYKVRVSETCETTVERLYCSGNGAGISSGIVAAASNGYQVAKGITGYLRDTK